MSSLTAASTMAEFVQSMKPPKIVFICGSQREGSFNRQLLDYAMKYCAAQGATCEVLDLEALALPIFNPNTEKDSFPEGAKTLKAQLVAADGVVITGPEYNGMISPLLNNAICWSTRGEGEMYAGYKGKLFTVMGTSPGAMGGMRMIRSLQGNLQDMGGIVIPGHVSIGGAYKAFQNGMLVDERAKTKVETACGQLIHFARFEGNRPHNCSIFQLMKAQDNAGEMGEVFVPQA